MSTRQLEALFNPQSIVVVGASEETNDIGGTVLRNIISAEFEGELVAINSKGPDKVHGVPSIKRPGQLTFRPDMAILCTPANTLNSLIRELGKKKLRVAIILTGGLSRTHSRSGRPLMYSIQERARKYGIRILGPETIGVIAPHHKLNATFMHMGVVPGKIAFIGQSGTIAGAVIDWALSRGVGFSYMTTLGDGIDIGLEDLIDYLSQDRQTKAILLHIENIASPRRYISAVRAVSRSKPVIAIKSGRLPELQWNPVPLPAGLLDGDIIYDAVLRRAGVLRVFGTDEMFDALESLTRMKSVYGEKLHIVTNGLGPGVLAADRLTVLDGELGELEPETYDELAEHLPPYWTRKNPIDINYRAGPKLYAKALEILSRDQNVSNVLVLFAPTLREDSLAVAKAVIEFCQQTHLNVFTCWLGFSSVQSSRDAFFDSGVPTYSTPEKAVKALMHMVNHKRSQKVLRETPETSVDPRVNFYHIRRSVRQIFKSGRRVLSNSEARDVLREYNIPMLDTWYVDTVDEAVAVALDIGEPVSIRVLHEEDCIPFHYETTGRGRYRGRVKGLVEEKYIRESCQYLLEQYPEHYPNSKFMGFSVQPSFQSIGGVGFSLGITRDPIFGPLIVCGATGVAINVIEDRHVALPPLNMVLARDLLRQTHMYKVLEKHSYSPEQDINHLCEALVIISRIAIELPEIKNLEIVPLFFNKKGAVAVNATIELDEPSKLSILPYPHELRECIVLPKSKRKIELRPVRAEDEPAHIEFFENLSPETIRYRFFQYRKAFSHDELAHMLQIDYDREMAFIACDASEDGGKDETLGAVRAWTDADNLQSEFAIVIRDDIKGERLGWVMMCKIIEYCRNRGTVEMIGSVLSDNRAMLALAQKLGFAMRYDDDEEVMVLKLTLNQPDEWQAEQLNIDQ